MIKRISNIASILLWASTMLFALLSISCAKIDQPVGEIIRFIETDRWLDSGYQGTKSTSLDMNTNFGWIGYKSPGGSWIGNESPDYYNINMNYNGSYADIDNACYWPLSGVVSFFAYFPWEDQTSESKSITLSPSSQSGYPTITYSTPTSLIDQKDLMTAVAKDMFNESVNLQFQHQLTRVSFSAKLSTSSDHIAVIVSNVTILGASLNGVYNYSSENWSLSSPEVTGDVVVYDNEDGIALSSLSAKAIQSDTEPFSNAYLIPQSVGTSGTCKQIRVEYWVNSTNFVRLLTIPDLVWAPGQHVEYVISINPTDAEISVAFSVEPWVEIDQSRFLSITRRKITSIPNFATLSAIHPGYSTQKALWSAVYDPSETYTSGAFGNNLTSTRFIRIMCTIINVESQIGGLYEGEHIFQITPSAEINGALNWELAHLENFVDGDIIMIDLTKNSSSSSFYVYSGTNNPNLIGPSTEENAYTDHQWVSKSFRIGAYGEPIDLTSSHTYVYGDGNTIVSDKLIGPGLYVIRRTARD